MGMDIYFASYDKNDDPIGEREELRCRGIYHAMNDWCVAQDRETPESGERVSFDKKQWAEVAPKVKQAIAQAEIEIAGATTQAAEALGQEWLDRIWRPRTARVEYWFTN
jgi:hypothetical protein